MRRANLPIEIGRGPDLRCKGWRQEGILRMLENTLHNGEKPEELIIYGGSGRCARNWDCFHMIVDSLKKLGDDETLLIQSGKPVGIMKTSPMAPRVLTANANLVGRWATWEHFRELEARGLMMYGQYTAGTWCYIGTQGILQGTYETFAGCAKKHFGGTLKGKIALTAGLGGMGGAQPLAVKMADGVSITVEIDPARIERRMKSGYCDVLAKSPEDAIQRARTAAQAGKPLGIALQGNAAEVHEKLLALGFQPDVLTDQTSAHDPLNGYIPAGYSLAEALELRRKDPDRYTKESYASMVRQVKVMLAFMDKGAITFEYGNNIRLYAKDHGVARAFDFKGFVPLFIRDEFCKGRGPFRWVCLSGDAKDLEATDAAVLKEFPKDHLLKTWMDMAKDQVPISGLPSRTCWLALGERDRMGQVFNRMVKEGKLKGPIAMARDHLDSGSVAQPTRETEGMMDGSDAVADWPLLNALSNAAVGADLVSIHQGGGGGMGASISAGMIVVADGTPEAGDRVQRSLFNDPATGVIRHADAGYDIAKQAAAAAGLVMPMGR